ncbi:hypothetical protein AYO38_03600 [bacterium SCGC AG-212-C10]|nr:hypothetical protein AYO38_03600 [bacterium SCGC AG-212-C10]
MDTTATGATLAERLKERAQSLSESDQQLLLELAERLSQAEAAPKPKEPVVVRVRGMIAGMGPDVTEEDIEEVRKEMWAKFR